MGAHAVWAPSSAARWLNCPASVAISATLPNYDSDESKEGTRVHTLIENAIKGAPIPSEEGEDTAYAMQLLLDYVRQIGGIEAVKTEHRLILNDEVWGTADVFQPTPYVTTLIDYKNGAMDIQADRNMQMMTYACGALEQHGPSKFYRLVIVQPNSRTAGDVPEIKQSLVPLADVEEHRERIMAAVARGKAGEPPIPGRHCRYCPAFGNCPATQEMVAFLMRVITLAPQEVPNHVAVRLLRVLRGLEDFRKGLEKDLMKRFAIGQQVPEASIGTTNTHRKWKDDMLAVNELFAAYGRAGVDPVSPATAEKMGDQGKAIVARLAYKPTGVAALKY